MPAALSEATNESSVLSACAGVAMPIMAAKVVRARSIFMAYRFSRSDSQPACRASNHRVTTARVVNLRLTSAYRQPTVDDMSDSTHIAYPVRLDELINAIKRVHTNALDQLTDAVLAAEHLGEVADHLIGHFVDHARRSG